MMKSLILFLFRGQLLKAWLVLTIGLEVSKPNTFFGS